MWLFITDVVVVAVTVLLSVLQVIPDVSSLPETEQHLRPLPLHLTAHPCASHTVISNL